MSFFRSKRFLFRIYFWVGGSIAAILAVSGIMLLYLGNLALEEQRKNDRLILSQIENSIEFMHDSVRDACASLYNNYNVMSIMYNRTIESDFSDLLLKMNMASRSIIRTNPYIHSVYIYNNSTDTFYSSFRALLFEDRSLLTLIETQGIPARLTPIYRHIEEPGLTGDFLTYFHYISLDENKRMDGGIALNISTNWLIDNIKRAGSLNGDDMTAVMLVTGTGHLIGDDTLSTELKEAVSLFYSETIAPQSDGTPFYQASLADASYHISYLPITGTELGLLRVVESSRIGRYVETLQERAIQIAALLLLISLIIIITVSTRLYAPLKALIRMISGQRTSVHDEFGYIKEAIRKSEHQFKAYENEHSKYRMTIKNIWLQGLLKGTKRIAKDDFQQMAAEYELSLTPDGGYRAIILTVDRQRTFEQENTIIERERLMYAVLNIACEILSGGFRCEGVELTDSTTAIIIDAAPKAGTDTLIKFLRDVQASVETHLSLTVSAFISEYAGDLTRIPVVFREAAQNLVYRFAYGPGCIMTAEQILGSHTEENLDYSLSDDKQLIDALKQGDMAAFEQNFDLLLTKIKKMPYTNMMISLFYISDTIRKVINSNFPAKSILKREDINRIGKNLMVYESINDYRHELISVLHKFFSSDDETQKTNEKHEAIVQTARNMVLESYMDSELCLTGIADSMSISGKYLSRIFAKSTGVTLPEFINSVRMERANKLLETTSLSVGSIAKKVGINNESYFYSMFKKRYGASPREYQTLRALMRSADRKESEPASQNSE